MKKTIAFSLYALALTAFAGSLAHAQGGPGRGPGPSVVFNEAILLPANNTNEAITVTHERRSADGSVTCQIHIFARAFTQPEIRVGREFRLRLAHALLDANSVSHILNDAGGDYGYIRCINMRGTGRPDFADAIKKTYDVTYAPGVLRVPVKMESHEEPSDEAESSVAI